jgi:hypothetical protein
MNSWMLRDRRSHTSHSAILPHSAHHAIKHRSYLIQVSVSKSATVRLTSFVISSDAVGTLPRRSIFSTKLHTDYANIMTTRPLATRLLQQALRHSYEQQLNKIIFNPSQSSLASSIKSLCSEHQSHRLEILQSLTALDHAFWTR